MKQAIRLITGIYAWLVKLYPASYRAQFEQELVALFSELMGDAAGKGLPALLVVCLREFCDLPANLITEHVADRSGGSSPMLPLELNDYSLRTARWGAIGFGIGFAFIYLAKSVVQAFGWNSVGDFFMVWILSLGTILYGIAGGLGGAALALASTRAEGIRGHRAWIQVWGCAAAGFFALALGWFVTTIHIPFLLSSSASLPVRATVEGIFTNLLKPLTMGALITAFISMARDGRPLPLRWLLAGAVAFEAGEIASYYVAEPFLRTIEPFVESLWQLPPPPQSDGLIRLIGFLLILIQGTTSGAILGLIFGQRRTESALPLRG